jgi:phosphoketolase
MRTGGPPIIYRSGRSTYTKIRCLKSLGLSHVKPLVVGHWGTTPGQNFIYVHLNRVIKKYDLDVFYPELDLG